MNNNLIQPADELRSSFSQAGGKKCIYFCCDEHRRDAVRAQHTIKGGDFNGIDYLEVVSVRTLLVHFIHPLKPDALGTENVRISGGERIQNVKVVGAVVEGADETKQEKEEETRRNRANILKVRLDKAGDYSTYTLTLVADPTRLVLDPLLSSIDFTFDLPGNGIDCQEEPICLPEAQSTPDIDYMAKDFTSFRQLMLDRLNTLMPQWNESSIADMGIMLVETLAYVADQLSYQQDVIATEAYLSTARRRVSARRHARLLDYYVNEGCNARAWVQVQVNQDITSDGSSNTSDTPVLTQGTPILTHVVGQDAFVLTPGTQAFNQAMSTQPIVFETMEPVRGLFAAHNQIEFYTWGARECCLPVGTTSATLRGALPNLQPGDVLIFMEMVDPRTGGEEDAEPTHRHAVRLTNVLLESDPLGTWPNDQSGAQDDPANVGKVIAEYEIVEQDRLLIERARMISMHSGQRVERQEAHFEEETSTLVHRYIIQKPDNTTLTLDVRMQVEDHHVDIEVSEPGYAIQVERREEAALDKEKTRHHKENDPTNVPTDKLPVPDLPQGRTPEQIEEMDTVEFSTLTAQTKETEKAKGEGRKTEEKSKEDQRVSTRVVHTYRILREPDYSLAITRIEWGYEDALPFPLCISAVTDYENGHRYIEDVSIALGNTVLADHGFTYSKQDDILPNLVPQSSMNWAPSNNGQPCDQQEVVTVPPRFYPRLKYTPLTFAAPYNGQDSTLSATGIMTFDVTEAVPAIALDSVMLDQDGNGLAGTQTSWQAQRDLLNSGATDADFVVEVEADWTAYLRFGDNRHGMRPDPQTRFLVTYRVGNGTAGNIGPESLYHLISADTQLLESITSISNPLPALGGIDPESVEDIRQNATGAFTLQKRGVTPQDYIDIVTRDAQVHRANAILRWTGSWYTVFLAVERAGGLPVDDAFKQSLRQLMEQYRMAGTDLVIVSPVYVPLEIAMQVTAKPGYLPANVKAALSKVFSNRQWPDGTRGVFYPDNYSFGKTVYRNPLYVVADATTGVDTVEITAFQRQGIAGTGLKDGMLAMDWLEIPILENNPNYPEQGLFTLTVTTSDVEAQYVRG